MTENLCFLLGTIQTRLIWGEKRDNSRKSPCDLNAARGDSAAHTRSVRRCCAGAAPCVSGYGDGEEPRPRHWARCGESVRGARIKSSDEPNETEEEASGAGDPEEQMEWVTLPSSSDFVERCHSLTPGKRAVLLYLCLTQVVQKPLYFTSKFKCFCSWIISHKRTEMK